MGELTRNHDWSKTALGTPDQWPQSLKTTLGIILHSAFPMLLFWGEELICFYNDAFRPSLGKEGKHPGQGKKGPEMWAEIWDFIGPLINQVMKTGEPVFFQDQLVPFYRNGQIEDIYWTFSYSPTYGDSGHIDGVFVTCTETTRAVLDHQKLQASEAQYRLIFEQAPVAIGTMRGEDLIIETANAKVLEILDKTPSIIGQPWFQVLPELVGEPAETIIKTVYRTGVPFTVSEFGALLRKNGKLVQGYYTFSYLPLTENGVTRGILQVAVEVTDQVVARRKVTESEAKLQALIEQAPVAMALFVGPDLVIELANELMINYFGKGRSILGKPIRQVLTNPGDQFALQLLDQVFTTGVAYEAKGASADLTIDGVFGRYYFDFSLKPLVNAAGEVYAILETAVEVTAQVLARQRLEETEAGLRGAVEMAQLGTWSIDVATNGLTYSDRMIEWFGYDPGAQDYNQVIPILLAEDQDRVAAAVAQALLPESDGIYEQTYTVIHPRTGQKRVLHAHGKTVFDASGKAIRLNGTARDITLQRELQTALEHEVQQRTEELANANEELEANNEELEEANQLLLRSNDNLQTFAYVASHDLQEPLRKIQQFGNLLTARQTSLSADELIYIERMQSAASRMATLIRDLLNFSHLSTQRDPTRLVPLNEVVDDVLNTLELVMAETKAEVKVDPLPTIQGDAFQLAQLFQNLLGNALKFRRTDQTGVPVAPRIRITTKIVEGNELPSGVKPTRTAKAYYRINVIDNGVGFDEKYLDRIFQVFQRLHGKHEFSGTGIGLAICERVVVNHGGAITASSQPGQGATFSIYLPA
ncbi:PAS domain-containing protein [Spirosoma aureum]|uniref:histidine kinase n=2 Tax=Spirosoma aureum TaxID=2692134 RepID=A0A6G9B047_9BACT|nr:PAS domain-containing protein [Spirosoma aureum]